MLNKNSYVEMGHKNHNERSRCMTRSFAVPHRYNTCVITLEQYNFVN